MNIHRREWYCNICDLVYEARSEFLVHLESAHKELLTTESHLKDMAAICERISTSEEDCPLCDKFSGRGPDLQRHLARHLQDLAMFTLPKIELGKKTTLKTQTPTLLLLVVQIVCKMVTLKLIC